MIFHAWPLYARKREALVELFIDGGAQEVWRDCGDFQSDGYGTTHMWIEINNWIWLATEEPRIQYIEVDGQGSMTFVCMTVLHEKNIKHLLNLLSMVGSSRNVKRL